MASDPARGTIEVVEQSQLAQGHARRVAEAKATVPHLYLDVEAAVNAPATRDIVVACATALREFPHVNGAYRDGHLELYSRVNVDVAVPVDDGFAYPTIADADTKDAAAIDAELGALTERAQAGSITQPELSGGTFTAIDLGPLGVSRSSAVVRRGQAAILTAGAVRSGELTLSLACDHRVLEAPAAAGFLARVRSLLEEQAAG